jgi:hypothetical protein
VIFNVRSSRDCSRWGVAGLSFCQREVFCQMGGGYLVEKELKTDPVKTPQRIPKEA